MPVNFTTAKSTVCPAVNSYSVIFIAFNDNQKAKAAKQFDTKGLSEFSGLCQECFPVEGASGICYLAIFKLPFLGLSLLYLLFPFKNIMMENLYNL